MRLGAATGATPACAQRVDPRGLFVGTAPAMRGMAQRGHSPEQAPQMSLPTPTSLRRPPATNPTRSTMHDDSHDSADDVWVQLVTRVPLRLHREAKMHSISRDTTLTAFIVTALRE